MAFKLQQELARTKPEAEVWGHHGKGDALVRPYLRRFRSPGFAADTDTGPVVSLFDACFPDEYVNTWVAGRMTAARLRQEMYVHFGENLLRALRPPDFASDFSFRISSSRSSLRAGFPTGKLRCTL